MMASCEFQLPPRFVSASHNVCVGLPFAAIRFSLPPAKNPKFWPSGDQNIKLAPSVPVSGRASKSSTGRTQIRVSPALLTTAATLRPSGDIKAPPLGPLNTNVPPVGGNKVVRRICESVALLLKGKMTAARATIVAVSALTQIKRSRFTLRPIEAVDASGREVSSTTHFSSLDKSLALCHRSSGAFARHFLMECSKAGGVSGF